ncbi:hypothetical protein SteCoe_18693 [Stentor coeruleus]|uniref:non-specific serine/threonine protein kinase n=1 Tax=Stentor coeruleus TaxID=5963 RepID=A0A1R2BVS6_9CILI|nr:hypothetical protein SteCoe_18693 [Stentor coeruleus]
MGCAHIGRNSKSRNVSTKKKTQNTEYYKVSLKIEKDCLTTPLIDYHSLSFLGRGGFSEVMLCKHRPSGDLRALKIIRKSLLVKQQLDPSSLIREASILESLNHPNILKFYECFEDDTNYYLATEYCAGETTYKRLRKMQKFSEEVAAKVIYQVLLAIEYFHKKGVIHRDIKLENVLLAFEDTLQVKIGDFGNACHFSFCKKSTGIFGSAFYLAPEVLAGPYTEKVDIWSCGIMLYILLTGKAPYNEKTPESIKRSILLHPFQVTKENPHNFTPKLMNFLKKLLEINPEKRFSAAQALNHSWLSHEKRKNDLILNLFPKLLVDPDRELIDDVVLFSKLAYNKEYILSKALSEFFVKNDEKDIGKDKEEDKNFENLKSLMNDAFKKDELKDFIECKVKGQKGQIVVQSIEKICKMHYGLPGFEISENKPDKDSSDMKKRHFNIRN